MQGGRAVLIVFFHFFEIGRLIMVLVDLEINEGFPVCFLQYRVVQPFIPDGGITGKDCHRVFTVVFIGDFDGNGFKGVAGDR